MLTAYQSNHRRRRRRRRCERNQFQRSMDTIMLLSPFLSRRFMVFSLLSLSLVAFLAAIYWAIGVWVIFNHKIKFSARGFALFQFHLLFSRIVFVVVNSPCFRWLRWISNSANNDIPPMRSDIQMSMAFIANYYVVFAYLHNTTRARAIAQRQPTKYTKKKISIDKK